MARSELLTARKFFALTKLAIEALQGFKSDWKSIAFNTRTALSLQRELNHHTLGNSDSLEEILFSTPDTTSISARIGSTTS